MALWPSRDNLDVEGWLSNFSEADEDLATALLSQFVFYEDRLAREVLRRAIRQSLALFGSDLAARKTLLSGAIFTCPPGEDGSPTASGYTYLRMLRELGVPGSQALHPLPALQAKETHPDRALIVIDDFSCTGAQFDHYWVAPFESQSGRTVLPGALTGPIVFSPLFAAWLAGPRLKAHSNVSFNPVHTVSGVLNDPSVAPHRARIREISLNLGAVDSAGKDTRDWKGFGGLSHAIAVGGTIPDSCLPILYMETNGWIPLKARRE